MKSLPEEVREYAMDYMSEYEFADNFRWYVDGDGETLGEYEKKQYRGCCGFVDHVPFPHLVNGEQYYFGFNYGH